jgi:hypothetical protein
VLQGEEMHRQGMRTLREWLLGSDVVILFGGRGAPAVVVASWEAWSRAVQMTTMPDDRAAV